MSSPYYTFGYQRRYPYAWHGGAGGVPWSRPGAETRELGALGGCGCGGSCGGCGTSVCWGLGGADLIESGLEPYSIGYPALSRTRRHALSDYPPYYPAGPERLDPNNLAGIPVWDGLSRNEKAVAAIAAAGLAFLWWKKRGKAGPPGSRRLARATRKYLRSNPNPRRRRRRRSRRR